MRILLFLMISMASFTASAQCFWMQSQPPYRWSPQPNLSYQQCYEMDSCNGGLKRSGGGCYKWADCPDCNRYAWNQNQPQQQPQQQPRQQQPAPVDQNQLCYNNIQGRIAWDYKGHTSWAQTNLRNLCDGTQNGTEPGACFNRVMHGGVNWGGGTQWQWENALNLCRKTSNASATISCFQRTLNSGQNWQQGISNCQAR